MGGAYACPSTCSWTTRSRRPRARTRSRRGRARRSAEGRTRTCTGVAPQGILSPAPRWEPTTLDAQASRRSKQLGGLARAPVLRLHPPCVVEFVTPLAQSLHARASRLPSSQAAAVRDDLILRSVMLGL